MYTTYICSMYSICSIYTYTIYRYRITSMSSIYTYVCILHLFICVCEFIYRYISTYYIYPIYMCMCVGQPRKRDLLTDYVCH